MTAGIQRPLRGSRITTFYPIKTLPSLASLDSAFQLQEYISLLIRLDIHDVEAITSMPGKDKDSNALQEASEGQKGEEKDGEKAKGDVVVDEACWVYEQLRRLAQDLTQPLITTLQQECTRASCPEMKAGEWLYLCVAHSNEGSMEQCCAIDYILHTLDSATALLNSPRAFPSRLQIPPTSHRHFSSLARRLGRIFAHAYFHHREAFEQAEVESSLYARFLALSSKFELVPTEFLPIPPEAFAAHAEEGYEQDLPRDIPPPRLLAASLDPGHSHYGSSPSPSPSSSQHPSSVPSSSSQHITLMVPETKGNTPPGLGMEGSPRRIGRNRTDTMVPSETSFIIEELAARAAEKPGDLVLSPSDDFPQALLTARPPPEKRAKAVVVEDVRKAYADAVVPVHDYISALDSIAETVEGLDDPPVEGRADAPAEELAWTEDESGVVEEEKETAEATTALSITEIPELTEVALEAPPAVLKETSYEFGSQKSEEAPAKAEPVVETTVVENEIDAGTTSEDIAKTTAQVRIDIKTEKDDEKVAQDAVASAKAAETSDVTKDGRPTTSST